MNIATIIAEIRHSGGPAFLLRRDGDVYRWYWPDGRPTNLTKPDVDSAQRLMMHAVETLSAEYASKHI